MRRLALFVLSLILTACAVAQAQTALSPRPTPTPEPQPTAMIKRGAPAGGGVAACPLVGCEELEALGASWTYTWSYAIPDWLEACDIESVPMIYSGVPLARGCPTLEGNSAWLLGFNEPDNAGEANLTPVEGATLWRQIESCYPDRLLVSPAGIWGWGWLTAMRAAYVATYGQAPRFDALGIHCYPVGGLGLVENCRALLNEGEGLLDAWDVDGGLWVNEWAAWYGDRPQLTRETLLMLESRRSVVRHAAWTTTYPWPLAPCEGPWCPPWWDTRLIECEPPHALTAVGVAYTSEIHTTILPIVYVTGGGQ